MVNVILNVRNRKYNGEDTRKPPLSFACMIFMAVESSPTKTLPVKDIYDWVMWKFPYYRNAPPGWKNSVRHNLSLNKCFKKVDRSWGKVS
jgi:forkhead box protein N